MPADFPVSTNHPDTSIDALDRAIVTLAARINAATYDLLVLIRRFDERGGWLRWGFDACADWLHWRCDLSLSAAREKVRVAHALKTLPSIAPAFASGKLSYSKVRALTRVAGPDNEEALLAFALRTTASRVEERCRELRCGTVASTDEALRAQARRMLSLRRDSGRGTVTIRVELPLEAGELIDKALDKAVESATDGTESPPPDLAEQSWTQQRADALVAMAMAYLSGNSNGSSGTPDHYQVVVHVDQAALSGDRGRSGLPVESVRRIGCDSDRVFLVEDEHGEPLSIGRKSRVVPAAIRRALWARDRGCRFPGCGRRRFVDAHHVEHWSNGGETCLENLMLLCDEHHRLVHEGGFSIEKDYRDAWFFRRPDGRAVPACGYRAADRTDDQVDAGESIEIQPSAEGCAVTRLSPEIPMVREPSAEGYFTSLKKLALDGGTSMATRSMMEVPVGIHAVADRLIINTKKITLGQNAGRGNKRNCGSRSSYTNLRGGNFCYYEKSAPDAITPERAHSSACKSAGHSSSHDSGCTRPCGSSG